MHMLLTSFGPTLLSLITLVAVASEMDAEAAWRICCGLTGVYCFTGSTKAMIDEVKGRHSLPRGLAWACPIGAQLLGAANLVITAGYFRSKAPTVLEATLIYLLWVSIVYFISLLKQEQAPA